MFALFYDACVFRIKLWLYIWWVGLVLGGFVVDCSYADCFNGNGGKYYSKFCSWGMPLIDGIVWMLLLVVLYSSFG